MASPKSQVVLLARLADKRSSVSPSGRSLRTILIVGVGALLCFGLVTSQVSSIWITKSNDNVKQRNDQTLLRVGLTQANASEGSSSGVGLTQDNASERPSSGNQLTLDQHACSPPSVGLDVFSQNGEDRFFSDLKRANATSNLAQPPEFRDKHAFLCTANKTRSDRQWSLCLPISGRKDEPYCVAADRRDLLVRQSPTTLCYASVLHMLMVEVYNMFESMDMKPALVYGTLLGAVRNHALIPFTEDVDIGYQLPSDSSALDIIREKLWLRGYHMFRHNIWRVCTAPTHPLARSLFDPNARVPVPSYSTPYVDLYSIQRKSDGMWNVQEAIHGRRIPDRKMVPYSKVRINGVEYNTVADPVGFLAAEYGASYMTPHRRQSSR